MSHERRVPPHDRAAEEAVVGSCLLNRQALTEIRAAGLRSEHFYSPVAAHAWAAVETLDDRGDPVDAVTVSGELDDDRIDDLLRWQMDAPSTANAVSYARAVRSAARRRDVIAAGRAVAEAGWTLDADAAVAAAAEAVAALDAGADGRLRRFADVVDTMMARWETPAPDGVGVGIDAVDRVVRMRPGELHIVGARTGVGKSSYLLAAAGHVARHHGPVLVFSLEMTADEVAARMLSHQARGAVSARVPPSDRDDDLWRRIMEAVPDAGRLPVWIDDSTELTVAQIRATAAQHAAVHGAPALVVVDYAQLVDAPAGETRQMQVAAVTRGLKTTARALGCPVLAASQLRRPDPTQHRTTPPGLHDLRESGAIEQDADSVLLLHALPHPDAERVAYDRDLAEPAEIQIRVAKNRHGPAQTTLQCRWYPGWALIVSATASRPVKPATSEPHSERLPYRD